MMTLTWSGAVDFFGVKYYHIFMDGKLVERAAGNTDSWDFKGLTPETEYEFRVEAEDEAGQLSGNGPTASQQTADIDPPYWNLPGEVLTLSDATETTLKLSWPPASDNCNQVRGYKIFRDDHQVGTVSRYINEFMVTGLTEGEAYDFEVYAYDEWGTESDPPLSASFSTLPPFVVEPLITDPADQVNPDISGNIIVWQDKRNDDGDIYMYNLETGTEKRITNDPAIQFDPRVCGSRIVWVDMRNGNPDIFMYDTLLGEIPICTDPADQFLPAIHNDIIVWRDGRNGNFDIYMYDLNTMMESPVCTRSSYQNTPDVYLSSVVYADDRNGNWDIFMYNVVTKKEQVVCKRSGDQTNPTISGGKYFYDLGISYVDGNDMYVYYPNFMNSTEYDFKVPMDVYPFFSVQRNPHLEDMQVVCEDNLGGDGSEWNIYAYDFRVAASGKRIPVCVEPLSDQRNPRTSKKNIVWEDDRNGNKDIYIWKRPPGSDLQLSITDSPDPVGTGDTLHYYITLTNDGPQVNTNIKTVCTIPVEAKYIRSFTDMGTITDQGLTLTWDIPSLRCDSSAILELTFQAAQPCKLMLKASVTGSGFETNPLDNTVQETTLVKEIIPSNVDDGSYPAIFSETDGTVHMSYISGNTLIYASKIPKGTWKYKNLGNCFECRENVITMDIDKNIHIINSDFLWDQEPKSRLYHSIVEPEGAVSRKVIAVSDSGFSNLALKTGEDNELYLAFQQAESGMAWPGPMKYFRTINQEWIKGDTFDPNGYDHLGLVLDGDNNMHFSNYSLMYGGIMYQKRPGTTGAQPGIIEKIDPDWSGGQLEGMTTSIDLDSNGNPHVSYAGSVNGDHLEHLKYGWKTDGNWQVMKIDEGASSSTGNKIHIGIDDVPNFAYHHRLSGEVRTALDISDQVVKRTIWENVFGWDIDMDMDGFNDKHITWTDDEKVKYAKVPFPEYFIVDPGSVDFGYVPEDSTRAVLLELTNPMAKDIAIDSIVCDDERISFDRESFILYRYQSEYVEATFTQTGTEKADTYLRIYYASTSGLFIDVPVVTKAFAPSLTVIPNPVDFGKVQIYTDATKEVTVRNDGVTDLVISDVEVIYSVGPYIIPTDFTLEDNGCTTLAPGEECIIIVGFSPKSDKGFNGHVSYLCIASNDPEQSYLKVKLTGDVLRPLLLTSGSIDFGYCEINNTVSGTLLITNGGEEDLLVTSMILYGGDTDQFSFSNPCSTIEPGDTCEVTVNFNPTISGDISSSIKIGSNFTLSPSLTINLKGTSLHRELDCSPAIIDFGESIVGETAYRVVELSNPGTNPVAIEEAVISGPDSPEFTLDHECPTIPAGSICRDTIWFNASIEGNKNAYLQIISNDSDSPIITVNITATASPGPPLQAVLSASPLTGTDPLTVIFSTMVYGGQPPYHYMWDFDDGDTSTDESPVHEFCCTGAYDVSLRIYDALSEMISSQVKIVVGSPDVPAAGILASPSSGQTPLDVQFNAITVGGSAPLTYTWDFGDGYSSTLQNPAHNFSSNGDYDVWLTVADLEGDLGYDHVVIKVGDMKYDLSGNITDPETGSYIEKSIIEVYRENYDNLQVNIPLDGSHYFIFDDLLQGTYTVKAIPDPVMYPDKLPTYYGNVLTMADALWITLDSDMSGKDIDVITMPEDMNGDGSVSGQLAEGEPGKGIKVDQNKSGSSENGIPWVSVYLKDSDDFSLKASDITDSEGHFLFDNLDDGSYLFVADYRGLPMDPGNKSLDISDIRKDIEILALAGTNGISVEDIATGLENDAEGKIRIYPVPAGDRIMIEIPSGLFDNESLMVSITDLWGRKIYNNKALQVSGTVQNINIETLPDGIYILRISDDRTSYIYRIIKMR